MEFGLFYNMDTLPDYDTPQLYSEVLEQIALADGLGFETAWIAEHHFAIYGKVSAPLLFLMRAAGQTNRIRLGTAVLELPFYHPLRIAEDIATADVLCNGRLDVGLGSGTRNKPVEFANFGISPDEKGERLLEMVELLDAALSHDPFSFHGSTFQYEDVRISPRPIQSPHEMIWIAGSEQTVAWAGERGYKLLMPRVISKQREEALLSTYHQPYRAAGHGVPEVGVLRFVYVAPTMEQARIETADAVRRYARYDQGQSTLPSPDDPAYDDVLNAINFIIGDPDYVVERIVRLRAATGCTHLICQIFAAGIPHELAMASMQLLSRTVIPRFYNP